MEHRYSQRAAAGTPVNVLKRGEPYAVGHAKDLSRRGVFIEMDSEELVVNQTLEIQFRPSSLSDAPAGPFKAVIARITAKGIGVEFEGLSKEDFDRIKKLVEKSSVTVSEQPRQPVKATY